MLNHDDLEAIDLTREDGATGGWNQARLHVREAGKLDAGVSGVLFEKNQVRLRYAGLFGVAVPCPHASRLFVAARGT